MEPSKMYHIIVTGKHYGRAMVKVTSSFFTIAPERGAPVGPGSPYTASQAPGFHISPASVGPVAEGCGSVKSPLSRHATARRANTTLTKSTLLTRFNPWQKDA